MKCAWCKRDIETYQTSFDSEVMRPHNGAKLDSLGRPYQCPGSQAAVYYHTQKKETDKKLAEKRICARERQRERRKAMLKIENTTPEETEKKHVETFEEIKQLEIALRFMVEEQDIPQRDAFFEMCRDHVSRGFELPKTILRRIATKIEKGDEAEADNIPWAICEFLKVAVAGIPKNRRFLVWNAIDWYSKTGWRPGYVKFAEKLWKSAIHPDKQKKFEIAADYAINNLVATPRDWEKASNKLKGQ